jgi:transposase
MLGTNRDSKTAIRADHATIFLSLELSRATWLVSSLLRGHAKISTHLVKGGDGPALLALIARLKDKAADLDQTSVTVVAIQEAGLDGFWVHRLLEQAGIESWVVDPASVAVPRRQRRAKTDRIDGETLLRTLLAWKRGEPRVCSMVIPPSPEQEDKRRLSRERDILIAERIRQTNRVRGLLASQGVHDYDPLHQDAGQRLEAIRTGDGRPLLAHLKAEIRRALERIALLRRQIREIEASRDDLLHRQPDPTAPLLVRLKGIGPEGASVLCLECFFRRFGNRRQLAAYSGLAASPWQSGTIARDQGVSKAGNPRLRKAMVELAWLWLRWQPGSALSRWFRGRVGDQRGRVRRIAIVALARKLLIALWRFASQGVVPEGAAFKTA